jgi:hypothetical protein
VPCRPGPRGAAGGLHLVAFLEFRDVAEDDATDFVLFEIERDADRPAGELHHLVIHHVREALDLRDAVGDRADVAGVLLDRLAGELGDLLFNLFEDGAHRKSGIWAQIVYWKGLDRGGKLGELAGNGGFVSTSSPTRTRRPASRAGLRRAIQVTGGSIF